MKHTNLLPKTQQREVGLQFFTQKLWSFWIWIVFSHLVFLILALLAKSYLDAQIGQTNVLIDLDKQTLKSSDNELLKKEVGDLNSQIAGITNLTEQHYFWSPALAELSNLFGPDLKLDLMSFDRLTGKVEVKGTGTRESVLKFWSDMHKSDYFQKINFPLANLERATDDTFTFTFYVVPEKLKQP